jgi:hypothetical protein
VMGHQPLESTTPCDTPSDPMPAPCAPLVPPAAGPLAVRRLAILLVRSMFSRRLTTSRKVGLRGKHTQSSRFTQQDGCEGC